MSNIVHSYERLVLIRTRTDVHEDGRATCKMVIGSNVSDQDQALALITRAQYLALNGGVVLDETITHSQMGLDDLGMDDDG